MFETFIYSTSYGKIHIIYLIILSIYMNDIFEKLLKTA